MDFNFWILILIFLANDLRFRTQVQIFSALRNFEKGLHSKDILICVNSLAIVVFMGIELNSMEILLKTLDFQISFFEAFSEYDIMFGLCMQILQIAEYKGDQSKVCE